MLPPVLGTSEVPQWAWVHLQLCGQSVIHDGAGAAQRLQLPVAGQHHQRGELWAPCTGDSEDSELECADQSIRCEVAEQDGNKFGANSRDNKPHVICPLSSHIHMVQVDVSAVDTFLRWKAYLWKIFVNTQILRYLQICGGDGRNPMPIRSLWKFSMNF